MKNEKDRIAASMGLYHPKRGDIRPDNEEPTKIIDKATARIVARGYTEDQALSIQFHKPETISVTRLFGVDGMLTNIIIENPPCGCKVVGNGSLPQPLTILFCTQHSAHR